MKELFDAAVLKLLGPKTDEDLKPKKVNTRVMMLGEEFEMP